MNTLIVKDFDTALDALREKYILNNDIDIKFSNDINIQIKLEGAQWDGKFDYKIAEFAIRLQKYVLALYNNACGTNIRYGSNLMNTSIRITVTVQSGCSLVNIDLGEWASNMLSADLKDALIVIAGIAGVCWLINKGINCLLDYKKAKLESEEKIRLKLEENNQNTNNNNNITKLAIKSLELAEKTQSHMSYLSSKLKNDEQMTVNNTTFSPEEARKIFNCPHEIEDTEIENQYFIDGEYAITTIYIERNEARISFQDKKRLFSTFYLDKETLEILFKCCATYQEDKKPLPIPLQLTATFVGGVFKHGFIVGVGAKREGAMTYAEASLASSSRQEDIEASQED